MNVDGLVNDVKSSLGRVGQSFFLQGDASFNDTLTLGQVIKGKVLRHHEGSRYDVSFNGQNKIVDSTIPLKTSDWVYGRVVALGDRVHLQRVEGQGAQPDMRLASQEKNHSNLSARERMVAQLFDKYRVELAPSAKSELMRLFTRSGNVELAALSALLVKKIGLTLTPDLLKSVARVMDTERPAILKATGPQIKVELAPVSEKADADVMELAQRIDAWTMVPAANASVKQALAHDTAPNKKARETEDAFESTTGGEQDTASNFTFSERFVGSRLMNTQGEGSVAHRMASLPIWFGDRVVEVSLALFSQKEQAGQGGDVKYRKIVMALDFDLLGHVEIIAHIANNTLRLDFRTQDDAAAGNLAEFLPELKVQLDEDGWHLDGINYATVLPSERGEVVKSVVEHYVVQDSVNHLI